MDFLILLLLIIIIGIVLFVFLSMLYMFLTIGFKNTGRIQGGLFTIRGKPGQGKSYVATHFAIEELKKGKRLVFSNYPIIYNDGKRTLSSRVFDPSTINLENYSGSVIVHDESHKDNWSRDFKKFSQEKKNFYSEIGQREITYYSIVQHEDRQDTIINDNSELFCVVEKVEIPFFEIPVYFNLTWWADEQDLKDSRRHPDIKPWHTERVWFSKEVANAYNTRFFAKDRRPRFKGKTWIEHNKEKGIESRGSKEYSNITQILLAIEKRINSAKEYIQIAMRKKEPFNESGDRFDRSLDYDQSKEENKNQEKKQNG